MRFQHACSESGFPFPSPKQIASHVTFTVTFTCFKKLSVNTSSRLFPILKHFWQGCYNLSRLPPVFIQFYLLPPSLNASFFLFSPIGFTRDAEARREFWRVLDSWAVEEATSHGVNHGDCDAGGCTHGVVRGGLTPAPPLTFPCRCWDLWPLHHAAPRCLWVPPIDVEWSSLTCTACVENALLFFGSGLLCVSTVRPCVHECVYCWYCGWSEATRASCRKLDLTPA